MTAGAERLKAERIVSRQGHSGTDAFHGSEQPLPRCHHVPRFSLSLISRGADGHSRGNRLGRLGARECRVAFRPKVSLVGQSVPSRTILRGSVDVNRPTAAPELAWRPKFTSLGMSGRGQARLMSAGFEGVHTEAVASDCSAGQSTWFIVLNAHAKRGQCPTTIEDGAVVVADVRRPRHLGLSRRPDSTGDPRPRVVHRTSPINIGRGIGNALGFTGGRFSASMAVSGGRFSARREGDSAWISH